ncbi:hypothetical protein DPMN_083362 [Dreissena polymorpha]|uniref:Uncharacterized protein n=1 Tax=Dreissena polymorpha TaxID=45954 RepID=A0A9D4BID4_DREPO|nr:hypothetical protein DPMN_083362 [Dreissena polymorpha]
MTLRKLYRSNQLTTLVNRLGICESHAFGIELVFYSEFDNFDQLMNTLRGTDSVHTAHGIMLTDVICETDDPGGVRPVVGEISRTMNILLKALVEEELSSCWVGQRKSPHYTIKQRSYPRKRAINHSKQSAKYYLDIHKE